MAPDRQLLRQYVRQGSQAAFSQLVARHVNLVYSLCLREVRDSALAEDVTQVVFLLLAKKAPALRSETHLSGWLFHTARFACKNALRREARHQRREQKAVAEMPSSDPDENALWDQIGPTLNDALAALGPQEREAVLLRFFEESSFGEIGAALGTSEDAARMRLNRAVDRLRRFYAKEGVAVSAAVLLGLLADRAVQAAPAACAAAVTQSGEGAISPNVHLQLQGALKAMTISKLKLAATIGMGVVLAGSLPFVTQAQNHAGYSGKKAMRTAVPKAIEAAAKPVPLIVPKSLHVVYLILEDNSPAVPAEYWAAGPNAARWTSNGRYPTTIATDGKTWTELMEPPNAGSVIKLDPQTAAANPAPTQPSLMVERARSWNTAAPGVYGPGVMAGEVPFLGFGQPGKIYRNQAARATQTADGWVEHCRIPYGYGSNSATGKPSLVIAVLTYDRQGRLVRFRRNRAGDIWENSTFSNFITMGGIEIPRLIRSTETNEAGGHVVTDMTTTYQAQSFDERPMPLDWFTMQRPPAGTFVQDYRFASHMMTPGLSGENSSGVLYRYSGQASLDQESRAQYQRQRDAVAKRERD